MSENLTASEILAGRITALDEQITQTKDDAVLASRLIAQMRLTADKKKVKELTALKNALMELQKEALKEEAAE